MHTSWRLQRVKQGFHLTQSTQSTRSNEHNATDVTRCTYQPFYLRYQFALPDISRHRISHSNEVRLKSLSVLQILRLSVSERFHITIIILLFYCIVCVADLFLLRKSHSTTQSLYTVYCHTKYPSFFHLCK